MSQPFSIQKQIYDISTTIVPRNPLLFWHVVGRIRRLLKEHAGNGLLLDLGGYDGTVSEGFDAIVLDISQHGVALARDRGLQGCLGDFHQIPFANDSFGAVLVCHALEHSSTPLAVLKEIGRVLKPGGYAVVLVPNAAALGQIVQLLRGEVKPSGNRPFELPEHYGHYTLKNMKELLALAENLEIINICGDNVWIPFMNRFRLYVISTKLGLAFPRLSDSLIVVLRNKKEDISARKALAEFEKL